MCSSDLDIFVQKAFAGSLGSQINESTNFSNVSDHNDLTKKIVEIAIPLGVGCAIILLVYGGYVMMSSQGNPDKLQEGGCWWKDKGTGSWF